MRARKPPHGRQLSRPIGVVFTAARGEAEQARHGYIGLEHLLLVLAHPTAPAGRCSPTTASPSTAPATPSGSWSAPAAGTDLFDPATLLATLGVDLDQIRRQVKRQFGPDAVHRLYASEVGWNLRPRGPLCDLPIAPNLKKAISDALGGCWDNTPPALHPRLLIAALDTPSPGLTAVLHELDAHPHELRTAATAALRLAS